MNGYGVLALVAIALIIMVATLLPSPVFWVIYAAGVVLASLILGVAAARAVTRRR